MYLNLTFEIKQYAESTDLQAKGRLKLHNNDFTNHWKYIWT